MPDTTFPRVVIRYRNRARALVTVTEHKAANPQRPSERFSAECTGCLDAEGGDYMPAPVHLKQARKWADGHAAECRALPQPVEQV